VSLTALLINQALLRVELSAYAILAIESVAGILLSIYSAIVLALIYQELRRVELDELLHGEGPPV